MVQFGNVKFLLHQEEGPLRVTARDSAAPLQPYFAERLRESLQFIAAYPIVWAATIESTGSQRNTYIRGRPSPRLSTRIRRPVSRNVAHSDVPTWRLFEAYFAYVSQDTTAENHRVSVEWGEVLRSSTGLVETEALICAITVASICRYLQEQLPGLGEMAAAPPDNWVGALVVGYEDHSEFLYANVGREVSLHACRPAQVQRRAARAGMNPSGGELSGLTQDQLRGWLAEVRRIAGLPEPHLLSDAQRIRHEPVLDNLAALDLVNNDGGEGDHSPCWRCSPEFTTMGPLDHESGGDLVALRN